MRSLGAAVRKGRAENVQLEEAASAGTEGDGEGPA